tara:strand:- start:680 stop:1297 length:618 start_codon:yes stop_codon:yes gene_type:complete
MTLNIVFSNKSSPLNKKLIKFFQINLLSLNKASLVFEFEVAHPGEIDSYVKRGIKNYPVLVDKQTSVTGVEKIIQYLKIYVKRHNNKVLGKTDGEKLDDFWKQTIGDIEVDESGNIKPDDEGSTDAGDNLHHRIQEAFEQRNTETAKPGILKSSTRSLQGNTQLSRGNNLSDVSPAKTLSNMKSGGNANMDDVLMAKFFENQEES